jgi:hypothetical protein
LLILVVIGSAKVKPFFTPATICIKKFQIIIIKYQRRSLSIEFK